MATTTPGRNVNIRLKPDEYDHLRTAAQACGLTPHTLLRHLACSVQVTRPRRLSPAELSLAVEQEVLTKID